MHTMDNHVPHYYKYAMITAEFYLLEKKACICFQPNICKHIIHLYKDISIDYYYYYYYANIYKI